MERTKIHENSAQNTKQEDVMNRVNQSFDKMVQDVKEMINKNNEDLS